MKIEGHISSVDRTEVMHREMNAPTTTRVRATAQIAWTGLTVELAGALTLAGYEPEVAFALGQKVTLTVEDV